jgi:hypothetical protein
VCRVGQEKANRRSRRPGAAAFAGLLGDGFEAVFDSGLSAPVEAYAEIAKYQVPELRLPST